MSQPSGFGGSQTKPGAHPQVYSLGGFTVGVNVGVGPGHVLIWPIFVVVTVTTDPGSVVV